MRGNVLATAALFTAGVVAFCWLISRNFGAAAQRIDKRLGDITYALYLIHPAMISIGIYLMLPERFGGLPAYLFVLATSIVVAVAIFRCVERPVMRLRNVFRGRRLYD
jgi:peptidoglycan/LPS O-acetylase OafA/YrhL